MAEPISTPYVYQEFPRVLHGARGETCLVYDAQERDEALSVGWALLPVVDDDGVPYDTPEPIAEVPVIPSFKATKATKAAKT